MPVKPGADRIETPAPVLLAIVLPSAGRPITLLRPSITVTPAPPLPSALAPSAFVPIRLPSTWLLSLTVPSGGVSATPDPVFPEMTLRAPAAVPPIRLVSPPARAMPLPAFGIAAVPSALVPMKLPWMVLFAAVSDTMPEPGLPEMRFPALFAVPPIVAS